MKKSIKVLSLVLALAIICGALVIGAFAAQAKDQKGTPGLKVLSSTDFENASVEAGYTIKGEDTGNASKTIAPNNHDGSGKVWSFTVNIGNRHGIFQLVQSKYDGNKYITFATGSVVKTGGGPYGSDGYGNTNNQTGNWNTYNYQIFDVDVSFPTGRAMQYVSFGPQIRYTNDANSNGVPTIKSKGPGFVIWSDKSNAKDTNVYIQDNGRADWTTANARGILPASEWSHITYILATKDTYALKDGTPAKEGEEGAIACLDYTAYLVINNEILSVNYMGNSFQIWNVDPTALLTDDIRDMWTMEFRVGFDDNATNEPNKNAMIAIDNFSLRYINPDEYAKTAELDAALAAGKGASLAAWTDALYDANNMPFGTLAATIGEGEDIKYFDSLAKAVAAATAGQTIKLEANSNELITVDKSITVEKNGFTANLLNGDGIKMEQTDTAYVFDATAIKANVILKACGCGNCFGQTRITVYEGANIWDAIVATLGKEPACSYMDGETKYVFDGFTVAGNGAAILYPNGFNKDAVVTADANNKTINLTVNYAVSSPVAKVYDAEGNVVTTYYDDTAFETMVIALKANQTLQLVADVATSGCKGTVTQNATIDINGYTVKHLSYAGAKNSHALILVSASKTLTFTSSREGGTVISATRYDTANKKFTGGDPFIGSNGQQAAINVVGQVDGVNTLTVYSPTFVQFYGHVAYCNVDGGTYVRNISDNWGMFQFNGFSGGAFKNATFIGDSTISFLGNQNKSQNVYGVATIDNCVFTGGKAIAYGNDMVTATLTNCVINGAISNVQSSSHTSSSVAPTGDEIVIGLGCKLTAAASLTAVTTAVAPVEVSEKITIEYKVNDWTAEDVTVFTPATVEINVIKMVAKTVTVEIDGNKYTAVPGTKVVVPQGAVEGTQGIVESAVAVLIPADAKDGDVVKAEGEVAYKAGKIPMQFSVSMINHFQFNYFVPVVEGITYKSITHNLPGYGATITSLKDAKDGSGYAWKYAETWPGVYIFDETGAISVVFEYEGVEMTWTSGNFSAIDYVMAILEREESAKVLKTTVADMMEYVRAANVQRGSGVNEAFLAAYNSDAVQNNKTKTAIPADATNAAAKAQMAEDGYMTEITPFAKGAGGTIGIKLSDKGYGFKMYKKVIDEEGNPAVSSEMNQWRMDGLGYVYMHNLRAYALDDVLTIEVYESYVGNSADPKAGMVKEFVGEPIATYEWTLAGYINDNAEALKADAKMYDLAVSLYNYAASSSAYIQWKADNGHNNFW